MTQVSATLINGAFQPDQAVPLADRTRVRLTVETIEETRTSAAAWAALKEWIDKNPIHGIGRRQTRDEMHERR